MINFWMDKRYHRVYTSVFYYGKNPSFISFCYCKPEDKRNEAKQTEGIRIGNVKINNILLNRGFEI